MKRKIADSNYKKIENAIEKYIGMRMRVRRNLLGISQLEMAEMLHVSFQQVQKYEKGNNRISGSRFWQLSRILNVPVSYFFDGIELYLNAQGFDVIEYSQDCFFDSDEYHIISKPSDKHFALRELVDSYSQIKNKSVAEGLLNVIKQMATADMEKTEKEAEKTKSAKPKRKLQKKK